MREWSAAEVAAAAGARLVERAPERTGPQRIQARGCATPTGASGPLRAVVDTRALEPGDLFVGLPGANVDGGRFAAVALEAGAWGVLVAAGHAEEARAAPGEGAVLVADDPLTALQHLATAWRRALGAQVIAITGSTGKTSTKDVLAAMLAPHRRTTATRANFNTEIGLPLTVLEAPPATEALVLEMAMRGAGQIAELAAIAEPDVGLVVNVGPVHLEQMGSLERVAAEKGALLQALRPGGTAVIPADEPLLAGRTAAGVRTVTFGPGGDVDDLGDLQLGGLGSVPAAHMRRNALAALAAARALGVEPRGAIEVALSALRGQRRELAGGVLVIDDCYNANPMSMRAALDDLDATAAGRRLAVLGDMLELGSEEGAFHREVGAHARERGVDLLVTVGPLAASMGEGFGGSGDVHAVGSAAEAAELLPRLVRSGDTVLVKGSRGVGLEVVAEALASR